VQGRRSRAEFPARVLAKILSSDLAEVNLCKCHRVPADRRLGLVVHFVHENAHPLISGSVRVNRAARFPGRLDFDSFRAGLDLVFRVNSFDDQIGMSIEIPIFREASRVLRHACGHHIGKHTRHDRRPKHVIQSLKTLGCKLRIYIKKEIIDILSSQLEILQAKLERQLGIGIKFRGVDGITFQHSSVLRTGRV